MRKIFKKFTSLIMIAAMAGSGAVQPLAVHAEESTPAPSASSDTDENTDTVVSGDGFTVETGAGSTDSRVQINGKSADGDGADTSSDAESTNAADASSDVKTEITQADADGTDKSEVDDDDPAVIQKNNEMKASVIEAEKTLSPHLILSVGDDGCIDVVDKDGNITRYYADHSEVKAEKKDKDEEDKWETKDKYANGIRIDGSDGDTLHVKAYGVSGNAVTYFMYSESGQGDDNNTNKNVYSEWKEAHKNDKTAEKSDLNEPDQLEYDVTLKAGCYQEIATTFAPADTSTPGAKSAETASVMSKLKNALVTKADAYEGYGYFSGGSSPWFPGRHENILMADFCLDRVEGNDELAGYVNAYKEIHGYGPTLACHNEMDLPPRYGVRYGITSWNAVKNSNGTVTVFVALDTRSHSARATWYGTYPGIWDGYNEDTGSGFIMRPGVDFAGHTDWLQAASGSFTLPKMDKHITANVDKNGAHVELSAKYSNYYSLKGAQYDLYVDGSWVARVTTDANGHASWNGTVSIGAKEVTAKEVSAPPYYDVSGNTLTANISGYNDKSVTVTDSEGETHLPYYFQKADTLGKPVKGAHLVLTNHTINQTYDWVSDGTPRKFDLLPGEYTWTEVDAPNGYYYADTISFEIKPSDKGNQTFTMKDIPLHLKIAKIDQETKKPVAGAVLDLYDNDTNVKLYTWTSDNSTAGIEIPANLIKADHTYRVEETENPDGYYKLDPAKGRTRLIKIPRSKPADTDTVFADVNNKQIDYYAYKKDAKTYEMVSGAVMQVLDSKGAVLDEWTTDGNKHKINTSKMKTGDTYFLHEKKAPKGYYKQGKDQPFTINQYELEMPTYINNIEVTMYDIPISINALKVDIKTGEPVAGAHLGIYDPDDMNHPIEDWISDVNPHYIPASTLTAGKQYIFAEIKAPAGYYSVKTQVPFTVPTVSSSNDYDKSIQVTMKEPEIKLYINKRDYDTNAPIAGAVINILDKTDGSVVSTFTSSSSEMGAAVDASKLKEGHTYIAHEETAPAGYYLADDVEFTLPANAEEAKKIGYTVRITMKDRPIKLKFKKVDGETGKMLGGVILGVRSEDGTKQMEAEWTSDDKREHIAEGKYMAGSTYELYESDNQTIRGYRHSDPVKFTIPLKPEKGQENTYKIVSLKNYPIHFRIKKEDQHGNLLTGTENDHVEFEIYDTNGTPDNNDDDGDPIQTLSTADAKYIANGYWDVGDQLEDIVINGSQKKNKIYRIHESRLMNGYFPAQDVFIEINKDLPAPPAIKTFTITNKQISVRFRKVDEKGNVLHTYAGTDGTNPETENGFQLVLKDDHGNVLHTFNTKYDYSDDDWIYITKYVEYGKTYTLEEPEYPQGYYKAISVPFTVNGGADYDDKTESISIKLTDPQIYAKFRKEDMNGSAMASVDSNGDPLYNSDWTLRTDGDTWQYQVQNVDAGNTPVCVLDTKDADPSTGYIDFGRYLKENTKYRIVEVYAPNGWGINQEPVTFTTPAYSNQT